MCIISGKQLSSSKYSHISISNKFVNALENFFSKLRNSEEVLLIAFIYCPIEMYLTIFMKSYPLYLLKEFLAFILIMLLLFRHSCTYFLEKCKELKLSSFSSSRTVELYPRILQTKL